MTEHNNILTDNEKRYKEGVLNERPADVPDLFDQVISKSSINKSISKVPFWSQGRYQALLGGGILLAGIISYLVFFREAGNRIDSVAPSEHENTPIEQGEPNETLSSDTGINVYDNNSSSSNPDEIGVISNGNSEGQTDLETKEDENTKSKDRSILESDSDDQNGREQQNSDKLDQSGAHEESSGNNASNQSSEEKVGSSSKEENAEDQHTDEDEDNLDPFEALKKKHNTSDTIRDLFGKD